MPYDPTFAHEVAVIVQDGLRRMVDEQEDVFYYITLMNENYPMPGLKQGTEEQILKGMYLLQQGPAEAKARVQLIGSGTILRESVFAAELLMNDWGIAADVWSAPSLTMVARDGADCERWNMVNPTAEQRVPYATQLLKDTTGPIVSTTDYVRLFSDQIRPYVPAGRHFTALGTDGFGRSDSRVKLREFFEVNRYYVTVAALKALADEGVVPASLVAEAVAKYGIDPNKPNPVTQ
jgi:pyruvate dehydrogenase E1 component